MSLRRYAAAPCAGKVSLEMESDMLTCWLINCGGYKKTHHDKHTHTQWDKVQHLSDYNEVFKNPDSPLNHTGATSDRNLSPASTVQVRTLNGQHGSARFGTKFGNDSFNNWVLHKRNKTEKSHDNLWADVLIIITSDMTSFIFHDIARISRTVGTLCIQFTVRFLRTLTTNEKPSSCPSSFPLRTRTERSELDSFTWSRLQINLNAKTKTSPTT